MDTILSLLGMSFIFALILLANLKEPSAALGSIIKLGLVVLTGLFVVIGILVFVSAIGLEDNTLISQTDNHATVFLGGVIVLALFCFAVIFSSKIRLFVQHKLIRSDGKNCYFSADSQLHTLAIILAIFMIINTMANFILAGGVEGIAESLQETGFGVQDLVLNFLLYFATTLLGIGLLVRRSIPQSLERLGILIPKQRKIGTWLQEMLYHSLIGAFVGFGLFCLQSGMSIVWQALVTPEALAEQTAASQEIFAAFSGSLWLGFLLAITAGVGEELLFRGALQPIFGNVLVSLFFVILHSQYILTPASLIIFFVSLIFGLLRQHYSTSSAMVAHFVYNFSPFVLIYIIGQMGISL